MVKRTLNGEYRKGASPLYNFRVDDQTLRILRATRNSSAFIRKAIKEYSQNAPAAEFKPLLLADLTSKDFEKMYMPELRLLESILMEHSLTSESHYAGFIELRQKFLRVIEKHRDYLAALSLTVEFPSSFHRKMLTDH